jgi:hypothetical protein
MMGPSPEKAPSERLRGEEDDEGLEKMRNNKG